MKTIKMQETVVGDRISIVRGAVVTVTDELAKDLIKAKHAEEIKGGAAKDAQKVKEPPKEG